MLLINNKYTAAAYGGTAIMSQEYVVEVMLVNCHKHNNISIDSISI